MRIPHHVWDPWAALPSPGQCTLCLKGVQSILLPKVMGGGDFHSFWSSDLAPASSAVLTYASFSPGFSVQTLQKELISLLSSLHKVFSQLWEAAVPEFPWSSPEKEAHPSLSKVLNGILEHYCGNHKSFASSDHLEGHLGMGWAVWMALPTRCSPWLEPNHISCA